MPVSGRRRGGVFRPVTSAVLCMLVAGCGLAPTREPPAEPAEVLWEQRVDRLRSFEAWAFSGRAALSGPDLPSRTVRIQWRQDRDRFDIAFLSLIGQRVAELDGEPGRVELRLPDEAPAIASTSGELLSAVLGWSAPVEGLRYWILGIPEPGVSRDTVELDPWGRPSRLVQDGWSIEYGAWIEVGGMSLPRRLTVHHPDVRIRVVVDRWTAGPAGDGR